jgi:hypothetical protein
MNIRTLLASAAFAVVASVAASANAEIVNGSFEAGTANWAGLAGVSANESGYTPTDGALMASQYAGCGAYTPCTFSQTFTTAGGVFAGDANFLAHDYLPFNDWGFVNLFDGVSTSTLFYSDVGTVGNYGSSGWTHFSVNLAPGTYTVTVGVANDLDNALSSQILADHFTSGGAPEPAAWALMIGGFGLAGASLRRRRAVAAA